MCAGGGIASSIFFGEMRKKDELDASTYNWICKYLLFVCYYLLDGRVLLVSVVVVFIAFL